MFIALVLLACFTFSACGTSKASQEKMDNAAECICRAARSTLEEMGSMDFYVQGDYVICSDPNYNYFKGNGNSSSGTGLYSYYTVNTENDGKTLENNVYTFYSYITSYYSDADDYEYIIEVISGEVKHVYAAKSWDSKTVGTVHKNKNPVYLTSEYTTLQDVADSVGQLNNSSQYSFTGETFGVDTKETDSAFDFSSFDYYELLDEIIEACGSGAFKIFFIILIVSLIWCLFGYQVFQIFAALASLLIMTIAGLLAAVGTGSLGVFGICFVIGIILAVICAKSKGFSAFMLGVMNTFPITTIIALLLTQSLKGGLIIGFAISAVIGIITAVIKKPLIILSSAIGFGSVSGTALACMIPKTKLSIVFQIIFICLGIFVQTKVSHGLLESGSLIAYIKGKHNNGDCNTESIEELPREETLPKKKSHKKIKPLVRKEAKKAAPKCSSCGATLDDDSVFCIKCGNRIGETSITAPINKAPTETLKPKADSVTKVLTEKLTSAPADTEPHETMTETRADVIEAPKLSLGALERKDSKEKTDGGLVINVDKNTEKKPIGNSHFTSADDFDD